MSQGDHEDLEVQDGADGANSGDRDPEGHSKAGVTDDPGGAEGKKKPDSHRL